jgi:hypothetical protein
MGLTARSRSIILDTGWVSASVRIQESCRDRLSARLHDAGFYILDHTPILTLKLELVRTGLTTEIPSEL